MLSSTIFLTKFEALNLVVDDVGDDGCKPTIGPGSEACAVTTIKVIQPSYYFSNDDSEWNLQRPATNQNVRWVVLETFHVLDTADFSLVASSYCVFWLNIIPLALKWTPGEETHALQDQILVYSISRMNRHHQQTAHPFPTHPQHPPPSDFRRLPRNQHQHLQVVYLNHVHCSV